MTKITISYLQNKKRRGLPITMLTAYDCPTARIEDEAGVDAVLVGDSVGTVMLGYPSERCVTMADMAHHVAAVSRGVASAYLVADVPFGAAETPALAEKNCRRLMAKGARCVKIEGWGEKSKVVEYLTKKNIPVCAHLGYNPQIHGGKPRTFGTTAVEALELIASAEKLEKAGAVLCVLEKVAAEVAAIISRRLRIPTIGIGSGKRCDGQILVINDILGLTERTFRHARRYAEAGAVLRHAVERYAADVLKRRFPRPENAVAASPQEMRRVLASLGARAGKNRRDR